MLLISISSKYLLTVISKVVVCFLRWRHAFGYYRALLVYILLVYILLVYFVIFFCKRDMQELLLS